MSPAERARREAAAKRYLDALDRKLDAAGCYVIPELVAGPCAGCQRTAELREGYCFQCLGPFVEAYKTSRRA